MSGPGDNPLHHPVSPVPTGQDRDAAEMIARMITEAVNGSA